MTRELRRDVLLPLVILTAIAVVTTAGTVALLGRMAPAIERILADNLYSLEAIEDMLVVLGSDAHDDKAQQQFATALTRAEGNVTEKPEREHLAVLRSQGQRAVAGDEEARREVLAALLALGRINRQAVVESDEEAKRLGYAGAWAAAFLGALAFAWALLAVGRARRRIIDPLNEVAAVLVAAHTGDNFRRCRQMKAPTEVARIMHGVDDLLDVRALKGFAEQPSFREVADRQILLHLLEQLGRPAWVVTSDGSVDAANQAGLAALAGPDGERIRTWLAADHSEQPHEHLEVQRVEGSGHFVCIQR